MIRGMRRARGAARFGRLMPTRCEDIPARSARAEVDVAIVATRTDEERWISEGPKEEVRGCQPDRLTGGRTCWPRQKSRLRGKSE